MASNVYVKKAHIEQFFQTDLDNLPLHSDEHNFHENKYNFISELLSLLYTHSVDDPLKDLHNIVNVLLQVPNKQFENKFFSIYQRAFPEKEKFSLSQLKNKTHEYSIDDYLKFLRAIRVFIITCKEFNIEQKADLCRLERFFMKNYLKRMNSRS
ncbi:MAG: hypothetical protein BAJALOKI1v1_1230012 [Promethearchaeota archaeon]|nr:MAG: hypothetical protein BAJALOKI1v1_1230012 [Candidatus Lokiarchaeota archaeon]